MKISNDRILVLKGADGISGDLITIRSSSKTKKEMVKQIRNNLSGWLEKSPEFHDAEIKIDMAIVIYRKNMINRQDVDNIAKIVLDSLKGKLFSDDKQITRLLIYKQKATEKKGYDTDYTIISFRKHDPKKQMILETKKTM